MDEGETKLPNSESYFSAVQLQSFLQWAVEENQAWWVEAKHSSLQINPFYHLCSEMPWKQLFAMIGKGRENKVVFPFLSSSNSKNLGQMEERFHQNHLQNHLQ